MATSDDQRSERGHVSAWILPELRSQIEELAQRNDHSLSGEVPLVLRAYVDAEQQRGRAGPGGSSPSDHAAEGVQ